MLCRPRASNRGSAASRDVAWPLPRLEGEIQVDGRSDDPAWQAVAPLP